jgi:hypothetical protein
MIRLSAFYYIKPQNFVIKIFCQDSYVALRIALFIRKGQTLNPFGYLHSEKLLIIIILIYAILLVMN